VCHVSNLRLRSSAPAVVFIVRNWANLLQIRIGTNLLTPPNVVAATFQRAQARQQRQINLLLSAHKKPTLHAVSESVGRLRAILDNFVNETVLTVEGFLWAIQALETRTV
jgi:hypothetical protein